jgi:hypothetical protein
MIVNGESNKRIPSYICNRLLSLFLCVLPPAIQYNSWLCILDSRTGVCTIESQPCHTSWNSHMLQDFTSIIRVCYYCNLRKNILYTHCHHVYNCWLTNNISCSVLVIFMTYLHIKRQPVRKLLLSKWKPKKMFAQLLYCCFKFNRKYLYKNCKLFSNQISYIISAHYIKCCSHL